MIRFNVSLRVLCAAVVDSAHLPSLSPLSTETGQLMSARIEIPFPPHRSEPSAHRINPPWVPVEPRWEYKEVIRDLETEELLSETDLNAMGGDHWELAGIVREDSRAHYYFKRERTR
jgi:hypothetical protein